MLQDVEDGYTRCVAFVVPPRMGWPLPVYELALMTSVCAYDANTEVAITVVTPGDAPLAIFGTGASDAVAGLLADRGIDVISSAHSEVRQGGVVEISPSNRSRKLDRVVALPELDGPAVPGLPEATDGLTPIDQHCQVRGLERVDAGATPPDFQVKYGGVAAGQADAAAQAIAAVAGAPVEPGRSFRKFAGFS